MHTAVSGAVNLLSGVWRAIFGTLDDLKLIELPAEKSNIGKTSSKKTVHHLYSFQNLWHANTCIFSNCSCLYSFFIKKQTELAWNNLQFFCFTSNTLGQFNILSSNFFVCLLLTQRFHKDQFPTLKVPYLPHLPSYIPDLFFVPKTNGPREIGNTNPFVASWDCINDILNT